MRLEFVEKSINDKKRLDVVIFYTAAFLRIFATLNIFLFHYLGQIGVKTKIDFYALLAFSFISGYFLADTKQKSWKWLRAKYIKLLIPYWLVIIPALIANRIIGYKETTIISDLITLFGGNLFLENPVYVIGWYITFMLLLYIFLFVNSLLSTLINKIIGIVIGYILFGYFLSLGYYYISFFFGGFLALYWHRMDVSVIQASPRRENVFIMQKMCYPFFLIHGGILLFFSKMMNFDGLILFLYTLCLSLIVSVMVYFISEAVVDWKFKKILNKVKVS